jgi:hypothetical protein
MARSVAIKLATGNDAYPAMIKFDMDGETVVPTAWDVAVTVVTEQDDGTDVDASAAIAADTTAEVSNDTAIQDFVDALNENLTGARAWYTKNTDDEYVVCVQAIARVAQLVTLSSATFAAQ